MKPEDKELPPEHPAIKIIREMDANLDSMAPLIGKVADDIKDILAIIESQNPGFTTAFRARFPRPDAKLSIQSPPPSEFPLTPTTPEPIPAIQLTSPMNTAATPAPEARPMHPAAFGTVFIPMEKVLAGIGSGNQIAQFIKITCLWLGRGLIAPCEVLLRSRIGDRYISTPVVFACVVAILAMEFIGYMNPASRLIILGAFFGGLGVHNRVNFWRDRRGDYWHSYSEGESWLKLPEMDQWLAQNRFTLNFSTLVIEPVALLVAALFVRTLLRGGEPYTRGLGWHPLALYLFCAGIASFAYQLYCWSERRKAILDEKDADVMLEIRRLSKEVVTEPSIRRYCGVAYAPPPAKTTWTR